MAYNNSQPYPSGGAQNQQPYYSSYDDDRELPRLPSYSPQPGQPIVPQPSSSPFVGPFDDHVYPASHKGSTASLPGNSPFYGQGESTPGASNDFIPLQDQPSSKKPLPMRHNYPSTDHIYDAGPPEDPPKPRRRGFGIFRGEPGVRTAWVVWFFTTVQIAVFIAELVKSGQLTGVPIQVKPSFNPMIGPSPYVLISMGTRYTPCMRRMDTIQNTTEITWPCPYSTSVDPDAAENACTLSQACGFGGVPEPAYMKGQAAPNQWFRFITPMFLHAGLIHIGFNLLLQVTIGREMEQSIGPIRFALVYLSSGIFGFVLGGNFAASGISSTGASGSLFGIIALMLLELLYTWSERPNPWRDLGFVFLDIVISFVVGLLPGLDNFSHIGGFLMGLAIGICILHSPNALSRKIGEDEPPYETVRGSGPSEVSRFVKAPLGFFKARKPLWWVWWLIRAAALILILVLFIVLLNNFYKYQKECSWCKYLSCLPVKDWCEQGDLNFQSKAEPSSTPAP
ncbi:hypothetical protein V492_02367 [Pseudogymnoascus sp. VKM F-4246]|nr:hypothetical protein V492_02367 [Pseudogymnoascus sp. VKM F-4246]